jgi:predicted DNA-binding transcriptional regulator AlpA
MDDDDLLDIRAICRLAGGKEHPLNPSTIYRGIRKGIFPAPLKIGALAVGVGANGHRYSVWRAGNERSRP